MYYMYMSRKAITSRASEIIQDTAVGGAIGTVDMLVATCPPLMPAWGLAKGFFESALSRRSYRAYDWVQSIINNPEIFTQEILSTKEFEDGFVVALEQYIKLRTEETRKVAKSIFIGFGKDEDKESFPLERYNDALAKISPGGIKILKLLDSEIIPYKIDHIRDDMSKKNLGYEKPYAWWFDHFMQIEPLGKFLSLWIHENYSPNGSQLSAKYGQKLLTDKKLLIELGDIESNVRKKFDRPIAELSYLGIFKQIATYDSIGTTSWTLSEFGTDFINYLKFDKTTSA